ncbi:MAG: hypothetical protein B6244_09310 [Candidatus Cloacimonetes bacterium 4572_55]|nr:MAG: hypothetical protein B6244_09310 [Candidatus Cloacimonetes bacterium 4572_55]
MIHNLLPSLRKFFSILIFFALFSTIAFAGADALTYRLIKVDLPDEATSLRLYGGGYDIIRVEAGGSALIVADDQDMTRLEDQNFSYHIVQNDLTDYYQSRLHQPASRSLTIGEGSMGGYFTYEEIVAFVDSLQAEYPDLMSEDVVIGQTIEGRDIKAYRLSDNPEQDENEPEALIIGLHHAREPMSIVAPLYFTQWLLGNYETDETAQFILNERETWIIPILNIDGYVYNTEIAPNGGGMWRKNTRDNNGDGIFNPSNDGVDLNRNYGYEWGYDDFGSSPNPASAVYRGAAPFSEPETETIRQFCQAHQFRTNLCFHTFGDLLIHPWGYSDSETEDDQTLKEYALDMIRDSQYVYGFGSQTVGYTVNGGSDDWLYGEQTEKPKIMSYTPEIGDDLDGFWAPTDRILTLAEENLFTQIYTALVAGTYLKITDSEYDDLENGDGDLSAEAGETVELILSVRNKSYTQTAHSVTATLTSDDPMITVVDGTWTSPLIDVLTNVEANFTISVSEDAPSGHQTTVRVSFTDENGYDFFDTYEIVIGSPHLLFFDNAEQGMAKWDATTQWATTSEDQTDGRFSFTDTPFVNYPPNWQSDLTIADRIDLSDFNNAALVFMTKWHIQDHWDLAQFQVSTNNGVTWTSMAGRHTTTGTGTISEGGLQPPDEPVFNGLRHLAWVQEVIPLSDFLDENILFRFYIASNDGQTGDGWYLDDIMMVGFSDEPMPPVIHFTNRLQDTNDAGPFPVYALATDAQGVSQVNLFYSDDNGTYNVTPMQRQNATVFVGEIPSVSYGSTVHYYVEATDEEGNIVTDPSGAPANAFQFLVTDIVQDIAVNVSEIHLTVDEGETVTEMILIQNAGELPLYFQITDAPADPVFREVSPDPLPVSAEKFTGENQPPFIASSREITRRIERAISQRAPDQIDRISEREDDPPAIQDIQLIMVDQVGDVPYGMPDVVGVYADVVNNRLELTVVYDQPINPLAAFGIMSLDVDQNIETGSYPPGLGSGYLAHNIGSEYELVWDISNSQGMGQSLLVIDNLGQNFFGNVAITLDGNESSAAIPLNLLGNDDGNMDITCFFLPGIGSQTADFAPDIGHGTVGPGGDAAWLIENPTGGVISPGQWFPVEVSAMANLLEGGTYFAEILINSNDPDEPTVSLPVTLTVNPISIEDHQTQELPTQFGMIQNSPNPFHNETAIEFQLPRKSNVLIDVYNVSGQRVKRLVDKSVDAGFHRIVWDGVSDQGYSVGSGVYFYQMASDNFRETRRMILMR